MPPTQNIFYNVRVMYFICLWVTPLEPTGLPSPQQDNLGSKTVDTSAVLQGFWWLNLLWPCHCEELFQFAAPTPSPATEHLQQPKVKKLHSDTWEVCHKRRQSEFWKGFLS